MTVDGSSGAMQSRVHIRVGDVDIDLSGTSQEIDNHLLNQMQHEIWSTALASIRGAREAAIEAAREAARESGLPERGSSFRGLCEHNNLTRKPDQVLAAIQYLREVEGKEDSPPRVIHGLFTDAGIDSPGNLSLYLNRLRERGLLAFPVGDANNKNRYAVLTPEGRAHLDKRSRE